MCVHACAGQRSGSAGFLCPPYFLRQGLNFDSIGWSENPRELICLLLASCGLLDICSAFVWVDSEELNSGLHACLGSTLSSEPTPHPRINLRVFLPCSFLGEMVFVRLYGAAIDVNIRLDKNSLIMEKTYISLANQRTITIHNRSNIIAHFQWKIFATQEEEDKEKYRFVSETTSM